MKADFFKITAFGKTGEFCSKYFKKGKQVLVEGRIQNRTWEDQSGQKRYATDFIVSEAHFIGNNKENCQNVANDESISLESDQVLPF